MVRGREWGSRASHTVMPWTWEPRRKRKLPFLEKVGTAGPWTSGGTETEDSPPGPPPGEGVGRSSSPEKEKIPTSPGCPRQGHFVDILDDLGPGCDAGGAALSCRAQLLHQPRVGTTLVHLFECLGLVNLQESHGVQGGGCLARSTISFGRKSGCQLTGLGRETRTVPPSGGVSWAQVHRDRSLQLGNARVPPGHSAVEGSEDGGGGRGASGRERGHPRLRQLVMHLREERHWGKARLWATPRSEKPIVQPRGLGTGRSVDLQPDAHGCPGKHGRQLWVRCGGGDNTRGGQPHRTFILRGREPIPRCCDRHPIYRWRTELNAGRPVGQTSEITQEPDGMFAAWGVRGPWGCARRRGSYSNPQISQSASRRSSACRETSTGGGRGCQSFHKGKARSQWNHAHTPTTGAWVIHKHIFSVLEAQTLKTTIVSAIRRQETTATRRTRTKRHLEKDAIVRDLLF